MVSCIVLKRKCFLGLGVFAMVSTTANAFLHSIHLKNNSHLIKRKVIFSNECYHGANTLNCNFAMPKFDRFFLQYKINGNDDNNSNEEIKQEDQIKNENKEKEDEDLQLIEKNTSNDIWNNLFSPKTEGDKHTKSNPLPIQIQDTSVLYYDIFLILNLSVSISFWVVHRLSIFNAVEAFNEGCLLSILWILSGLYNGAFLYSAIDGNQDTSNNVYDSKTTGGPMAAGLLGLWTFVGTINLRMLVALLMAAGEHRAVGSANGEELIPLELIFGLVLMSMWRMLHSSYSMVE